MRNNYLVFIFLFFILLTVCSLNIPFFWDGTFFSSLAVHFYENGFHDFISPLSNDSGGFPMFPAYIALMWKVFGKSPAISHLVLLPFLIGIAFQYFKLCKRFLSAAIIPFALLLLVCEPVFITQSILMGYDILMIYFFMLALNSLLSDKNKLFALALFLLCMSNMRGMILGISLLLIELLIKKQIRLQDFKKYFPAALGILLWALYHYQKTTWFFISPLREHTHESLLPFSMIIRQILFIGWKVNDFGRIALWLFIIIAGCFFYRKNKNSELNVILKIIFIPLMILTIFMSPLGNPIGHKYFIVVFLLLNIGVCYFLQMITSIKFQNFISILFIVALLTGNFWIYPERLGNGWDSSLKVLPYFKLKNNMDKYISENKIAPESVGTQFPLIADKRFSDLTETSFSYTNVWSGPINRFNYFLQTNVINTDIPDQIEDVKKNWVLLKKVECGQLYISLYKNPSVEK